MAAERTRETEYLPRFQKRLKTKVKSGSACDEVENDTDR